MTMELTAELTDRLLFAVPKKGRLYEQTMELLHGADIQFRRKTRLDIALSTNLPMAIVFLPAADIGKFVGEGNVDLGITGLDVIAEAGMSLVQDGSGVDATGPAAGTTAVNASESVATGRVTIELLWLRFYSHFHRYYYPMLTPISSDLLRLSRCRRSLAWASASVSSLCKFQTSRISNRWIRCLVDVW